jgi:hypothetical protein
LPGFYEVEASKSGCGSAITPVFEVPPPRTGLQLVLHCSNQLHVETSSLPGAVRGQTYEAQLVAFGGREPDKWKKTGKLPKGLKLSKTGLLSGTPSTRLAAGDYTIEVSVSDSSKPKQSSTRKLELEIS